MAAPTDNTVLEKALGGLPLVQQQGLNTNKAANFSGTTIDASGNVVIAAGAALTGAGQVTGPTGSFGNVNIQAAEIIGASASVAILGTAGALAGGPTTSQQDGWAVIYVAGVKKWIPVWA